MLELATEVCFECGKKWCALLNSRLPSKVPSLFMKRCVSSTGGEMAVEVTFTSMSDWPVVTLPDVAPDW